MTTQLRRSLDRDARRKQVQGQGIKVSVDGSDYTVYAGDLSHNLRMLFREQVGVTFTAMAQRTTAVLDEPDLVAAVVWLARYINGERRLAYTSVADELRFGDDYDITTVDTTETSDKDAVSDPDPEV